MSDDTLWRMENVEWKESDFIQSARHPDHVITDPPFNERAHANGRSGDSEEVHVAHDKGFDALNPMCFAEDLLYETWRWCLCFCAVEDFAVYRQAARIAYGDDAWIRGCIWVKDNPAPQMSGDRPGMWGEGIATMHNRARGLDGNLIEPVRWNSGGKAGVYNYPVTNGEHHPCEKPVPLLEEIIKDFTDPGDLIFDPFAGSGTTGVACIRTGRNFVGCEKDEEHYDTAMQRLLAEEKGVTPSEQEVGQDTIFDLEG